MRKQARMGRGFGAAPSLRLGRTACARILIWMLVGRRAPRHRAEQQAHLAAMTQHLRHDALGHAQSHPPVGSGASAAQRAAIVPCVRRDAAGSVEPWARPHARVYQGALSDNCALRQNAVEGPDYRRVGQAPATSVLGSPHSTVLLVDSISRARHRRLLLQDRFHRMSHLVVHG